MIISIDNVGIFFTVNPIYAITWNVYQYFINYTVNNLDTLDRFAAILTYNKINSIPSSSNQLFN